MKKANDIDVSKLREQKILKESEILWFDNSTYLAEDLTTGQKRVININETNLVLECTKKLLCD